MEIHLGLLSRRTAAFALTGIFGAAVIGVAVHQHQAPVSEERSVCVDNILIPQTAGQADYLKHNAAEAYAALDQIQDPKNSPLLADEIASYEKQGKKVTVTNFNPNGSTSTLPDGTERPVGCYTLKIEPADQAAHVTKQVTNTKEPEMTDNKSAPSLKQLQSLAEAFDAAVSKLASDKPALMDKIVTAAHSEANASEEKRTGNLLHTLEGIKLSQSGDAMLGFPSKVDEESNYVAGLTIDVVEFTAAVTRQVLSEQEQAALIPAKNRSEAVSQEFLAHKAPNLAAMYKPLKP